MKIKTSQTYKVFALYFMSLAIYSMVLSAVGIQQGLSTSMFLVACFNFICVLIYKSNRLRTIMYSILPKLTLAQLEIGFYSVLFLFISLITEKEINGYFTWISDMFASGTYITIERYESFSKFILIAIVCIFVMLLIKKRLGFVTILLYAFFILSWHFYVPGAYLYSIIYTMGSLAFFVDKASFEPDDKVNEVRLNFYGPIIGIALSILALIIPLKLPVVYLDDFAQEMTSRFPILESMRETVEDAIGGSSFRFSDLPYQPNTKKLGGSVELSDGIALKVKAKEPLYLRGSVKHVYTGYSWELKEPLYYKMQDNKLKLEPESLGYIPEKIEIYPENLKTRTIFNPYFTYEVANIEDTELIYTMDLEIMRNNGQKNQTKPYEVGYFSVDYLGEREYSDEELEMLKPYQSLPSSVTDRTVALAEKITSEHEGVYKKLLALEDYLKNNYPYTLTTSELPEDRDFVDYFLFEEKKGYCTYFSSAMAVMARSIGIATRYVEGFRMDEELDEAGLYIVREDRAHAWVEAYIPGTGWLSFEPTGSLTQEEIDQRNRLNESGNTDEYEDEATPLGQDNETKSRNNQEDAGFEYDDSEVITSNEPVKISSKLIALLIGGALLVSLIFRKRLFEEYRHFRIKKEKGMEGFKKRYFEIIRIAKLMDEAEIKGTPKEIMNILNNKFSFSEHNLGELVNEAFYSGNIIKQSQLDIMDEAYESIFRVYIKHKNTDN